MANTVHIGKESTKFTDWCVRNYGASFILRINAQWTGCNAQNTKFFLNGNEHPYTDFNKDIQISPNTSVSIKLVGDSSAHVHTVDGIEIGYPIEYDIPQFTITGNKTINVEFTPYYT